MAERNVPGQLGLFKPIKTPDEPVYTAAGSAVWVYPCALCEAAEVDQAGALCGSCAPIPTPRPSRRRATKKTTTKATAKTTATRRTTTQKSAAPKSAVRVRR